MFCGALWSSVSADEKKKRQHLLEQLPHQKPSGAAYNTAKMRGKRSKQYRKLMEQYCMTFGFREAYQVLGTACQPPEYQIESMPGIDC